ncbi:MAG TPA: flagellar hook-associated protein FlgK [Solirubrobacteraceae bacterium]|nr:flagellar hook-associated protein FlgK [Solirubrobacteraceae bacterium]
MSQVSSFFGLQTSLRGLLAQQRMLDTTGHNIANANTAGYTRQQAVLQASPALEIAAGGVASGAPAHLGSGVDVQTFKRVRDGFTDIQYRAQNSLLGNATAQADALDQAQSALAEPGEDGINAQLQAFWDAWSDLSNSPTDPAAKQAVVEQAQSLGDAFSAVRSQIGSVATQTYAKYQDLTSVPNGDIAQAAKEIASLNTTISRATVVGDVPNDLLDRRDQLLDQLSGYGQISVTDKGDGSIDVAFMDTQSAGTSYDIVKGGTVAWTGAPASWSPGGQLGGLLAAGDPATGTLNSYLTALDGVAGQLASLVNTATGTSFFTVGTPAAATLQVTPAILAAPTSLAAGTGGAASNDIALKVQALRGDATVDGAYQAFVARVGSEVRAAERTQTNSQALVDNVADRRASISGVALDEEMTNMISFQRGYQASARAMSTMDDLLDVLINRTGRVGL